MKKNLLLLLFTCGILLSNAQITTIWSENFDTEDLSEWTLIDADGDGFNWGTTQMLDDDWQPIGTPFFYSLSYTQYMDIGNVFPDNWAITPAIDLTSLATDSQIQLNWAIVDSAYSYNPSPNNENYAIYIAESNDTTAFINGGIKYTEQNTPIAYTERTLDISDFAGKVIYIAFRHYNVSDEVAVPFSSSVEFDDMSITAGSSSISGYEKNITCSVFPNPANNQVTIDFGKQKMKEVAVIDIIGKEIKRIEINSSDYILDVSDLPKGVYLIKLTSDDGIIAKKIIKQ
jgi:hypothetical protein